MTTKITFVALILCTSFMVHAQVEQAARQLAENEHRKFAGELPDAFAKGRVNLLGNARAVKKQFFLEENAETFADFLGWDRKRYSQKTIGNVFKALSDHAKSGKVSVKIDFPLQPAECIITVQKNTKKATVVNYMAATKADVRVEVSRQGAPASMAYNNVTLIWNGRMKLVNGGVDEKKSASPRLWSMDVRSATGGASVPKEEQMTARAIQLIEEYYRNLQSPAGRAAVLAPEIPNKAELENWLQNSTKIETEGYVNLPPFAATSGSIEVRNVPGVKIHVDPAPSYHQLALTFTVDFQADKITKVVYEGRFFAPDVAPKPALATEPETVVRSEPVARPEPAYQPARPSSGDEYYKVQFLYRHSYLPLNELTGMFRVENVIIEKYEDGYKYVVPTNSLREATAIRNRLIEKGIEDAWIAVYDENEERIRPAQGHHEVIH